MNIKVVLLIGDTFATAKAIADQLGIVQVYAELLPEQKTSFIDEEVRKDRIVAMLGDGINDAPALSEANVGVAMGAGTDVARESADVVLIGNDLAMFVETIRVARNCRSIILQDFYGTLIVDHWHRSRCSRIPQSAAGDVHSCSIGIDVHPEFDAPAAS